MSTVLKSCTRCHVAKPLAEFHINHRITTGTGSSRGGLGVIAQCKACRSHRSDPTLRGRREQIAVFAAQQLKRCGTCKQGLPHSEFHKRVRSDDGLAFTCKKCVNTNSAKWREANPGAHDRWYFENKEHKLAYATQWRSENVEMRKVANARWAKANPHKVNALIAKRTAAKFRATVSWSSQDAIEAIYAEALRLSRETGIRHDVDHIVPLQGKTVSGLHWEGNLQILTKTENLSKSNRYWPDSPT